MSVVVSTFPSLNAFNSRSWTVAVIIALHAGFFWVLSSGGIAIVPTPVPSSELVTIDAPEPKPTPRLPVTDDMLTPIKSDIILPPQPKPIDVEPDETVITGQVTSLDPVIDTTPEVPDRGPAIIQPSIDPRLGISEPIYPASERRDGHWGTVMLAIEVLENGRIGQVRVESSSGYERLDDAAVRQAKRWRLKPGTRDGVPVTMWKRLPVHFRLTENAQRF